MKTIKTTLYVLGVIFLVIILFFKKDLPLQIANLTWIISGVLLFMIMIIELLTRRKNAK
jgi:hypothetical protein